MNKKRQLNQEFRLSWKTRMTINPKQSKEKDQ